MPHREQARLLVQTIAGSMVSDVESVSVSLVDALDSTVIVVHVADEDIGKIVGKKGVMARSIRTVLGAVSSKTNHRFQLEIKS